MKAVATKSVEQQSAAPQSITIPQLAEGEHYAGIIIVDGKLSHHLVLLPGEMTGTWKKAVAWAKEQGGELPSRSEQALLYANLKAQFQSDWYWSGEQYAPGNDCAWCQIFGSGSQVYSHEGNDCRVRAVRRLAI